MLKPVTKDFSDISTLKQFEFEFYCDCCGKAIKPPVLEFVSGFKEISLLNSDVKKQEILFMRQTTTELLRGLILKLCMN